MSVEVDLILRGVTLAPPELSADVDRPTTATFQVRRVRHLEVHPAGEDR